MKVLAAAVVGFAAASAAAGIACAQAPAEATAMNGGAAAAAAAAPRAHLEAGLGGGIISIPWYIPYRLVYITFVI